MFPMDLEESEKIVLVDDKAKLLGDAKEKAVCVVITTNRFIIYEDGNKQVDSKEILRITKGMTCLPDYDKLLESEVTFFEQIVRGENFDKYVFQNGNYFYLRSDVIYHYMKEWII